MYHILSTWGWLYIYICLHICIYTYYVFKYVLCICIVHNIVYYVNYIYIFIHIARNHTHCTEWVYPPFASAAFHSGWQVTMGSKSLNCHLWLLYHVTCTWGQTNMQIFINLEIRQDPAATLRSCLTQNCFINISFIVSHRLPMNISPFTNSFPSVYLPWMEEILHLGFPENW